MIYARNQHYTSHHLKDSFICKREGGFTVRNARHWPWTTPGCPKSRTEEMELYKLSSGGRLITCESKVSHVLTSSNACFSHPPHQSCCNQSHFCSLTVMKSSLRPEGARRQFDSKVSLGFNALLKFLNHLSEEDSLHTSVSQLFRCSKTRMQAHVYCMGIVWP